MQAMTRGCTPLVLAVLLSTSSAAAQSIPTPESVIGSRIGADFFLATYDESIDYFRRLAAATDKVQLQLIGKTSEGRDWYIAFISSPQNLDSLDRYKQIAQRLAHPKEMTDEEAQQLAREGKAIVHIDGGLHASEVAHAQHTIQLAYDLVSDTSTPEIQQILDNVILMLWPSINPDGQNVVVDWYRSNLGTPYEVSPLPQLYQMYIGHDNNRDGYMINMIESRAVTRVVRDWEPQILYNHHQTAPFPARIWIPPFAEPISEYVHPLMWRTVNLLGMSMAQALEERGQRGAVHMGTGFDNWYPGFMDHAHNFHNVAAFLTETGLYRYATPHFYTLQDFPTQTRELRPQSLYASPWEGGWWRLGDAVDYMLTASISVLDMAAKYRYDLLYNRYQAGRDVIAYYEANPPYAFFIPRDQRDPVAAVELLRRLAFNGIEVHELTQAVSVEGQNYPAGTWVIAMDQEFGNFVRQLFAVQSYPDLREFPEGPPDQPYDVAGWTLPYQMDVRVVEVATPLGANIRAAMQQVSGTPTAHDTPGDASSYDTPPDVGFDSNAWASGIVPPAGSISGSGGALALDAAQNNSFRAINQAWSNGGRVRFAPGTPPQDSGAPSSGRYLITGLGNDGMQTLARDLALRANRTSPTGVEFARPRVALYRPWNASTDEGWTRWLVETYGFQFTSLYNADVLAGDLKDRYDVILIAEMSSDVILEGYARGTVPGRYAGGIGPAGVRALDAFVRAGGTLVCLNGSTAFAIDQLHLPVENVVADVPRNEFFMSGSIVEMTVDPSHPVMTGMPERSKVFVARSPVFTTKEGFEGRAIAKYQTAGTPLLSGYLLGEEHLQGYAAALDVHHGQGHIVLLGMRPQWRGQPFGNFRILFNALLYTRTVADAAPENPDFWEAPEPEEEGQTQDGNGQMGSRQSAVGSRQLPST